MLRVLRTYAGFRISRKEARRLVRLSVLGAGGFYAAMVGIGKLIVMMGDMVL